MTLLSKTLQTFLYKYLLEVDVEGVAMPSFLDVDGHSGWGVRLCNVKLREGVVLMTLPGKRRIKRKQKQTKSTTTQIVDPPESINDNGHTRTWSWSTTTTNITTTSNVDRSTAIQNNSNTIPIIHNQEKLPLPNTEEENETTMESSLQHDIEATRTDIPTDNLPDSALSSRAPSPTLLCSQRSSMLSCLTRETPNDNQNEDDDNDLDIPSAPPSRGSPLSSTTTTIRRTAEDILQKHVLFDTAKCNDDTHHPTTVDDTEENEEDNVDNHQEEKEEYEWIEQNMVLQLGTDGRIGTLDVRLVGKDLHVMIEDAYLTVEACPTQEESDDPGKELPTTTDTAKTEADDKKRKTTPMTVAERIMENSLIAKALSAIPHLFLRDCTVRLIVRQGETSGEEVGLDDSVVEMGIELLSVTSGDDFMAGFRNNDDPTAKNDPKTKEREPPRKASLKRLEEDNENEYLSKRIRTGKGPESGISIKIYPPGRSRTDSVKTKPEKAHSPWAIQTYMSRAKHCFFRCSGLDIRARIYLGKKVEIAIRNNDYAWYGEEYDEYTIDSMLYGVDYIAPGPPPPLPPLPTPHAESIHKKEALGADLYHMDQNGVQSSKICSAFHKVARGLTPILCKKNHFPGDNCPYCWENSTRPNSYSEHPLDSYTPLPGVVLSISLNDPLEINVDRPSLEVLGNILFLFTKKEDQNKSPLTSPCTVQVSDDNNEGEIKNTKKKWSFGRNTTTRKESLKDAYPSYMVPENIEFMGLHLTKIILRLHVMRDHGRDDTRMSFRYWEAMANCVTVDLQSMKTKQKDFQDMRFGIGYFSTTEYRGIEHKELVSLGLPHTGTSDSNSILRSTPKSKSKSAWPSLAAVLLHMPAPFESEEYESNERHCVQMRYIMLNSKSHSAQTERSSVNVKLGVATVDGKYSLIDDLSSIMNQSLVSIYGNPVQESTSHNTEQGPEMKEHDMKLKTSIQTTSLLQYKVQIEGGTMVLDPLLQVRLPATKFGGENSLEGGFMLETLLKHVEFEYGKRTTKPKPRRANLSLAQLASLPECVRLRILLLLKDLTPLEKALAVTKESNSFLRCRAVNKAIVDFGSRPTKPFVKPKIKSDPKPMQRHEVMTELMKLDDHTLEELWKTHQDTHLMKIN